MLNKIINYLFPILTPGVLVLAYMVITQILDETITWEKFSFAILIFICWGVAFYYYRRIKSKAQSGHR